MYMWARSLDRGAKGKAREGEFSFPAAQGAAERVRVC